MIEQPSQDRLMLTDAEVAELTGINRGRQAQIDWLKANRIPHLVDAKGRPKVLRATIEAILGAPGTSAGPTLRFAR